MVKIKTKIIFDYYDKTTITTTTTTMIIFSSLLFAWYNMIFFVRGVPSVFSVFSEQFHLKMVAIRGFRPKAIRVYKAGKNELLTCISLVQARQSTQ